MTKPEIISRDVLLPFKFSPQRTPEFIVTFSDGKETVLDSFAVSSFQITEPLTKSFWSKKVVLKKNGLLVARVYSPISPSIMQQAWELLQTQKKIVITVKMLDPIGTIIQKQKFMGCKLKNIFMSELDYNPSDYNKLVMLDLDFTCDHVILEY